MNDLSLSPGYAGSVARDINNLGQISGVSSLSSGFLVASIWLPSPAYSRSAGWSILNPASLFSDGAAINDLGQVAGHEHFVEQAAIWSPTAGNGYSAGLNVFDNFTGEWGFATAINEAGHFAGNQFDAFNQTSRSYVYLTSSAYGRPAGWNYAPAFAGTNRTDVVRLNSSGEVAGFGQFLDSSLGVNFNKAFLWRMSENANGPAGIFDLGGAPASGYYSITPGDINEEGLIVGSRNLGGANLNAFLWSPTAGMVDLNTLIDPSSGWVLRTAWAINDNGEIAGLGRFNGVDAGYVLSVPEPAGATAALVSAAVVAAGRRRRP